VSDKGQRIVRIKWVRSGIGFSYRQKRIVRSLGLKKLNQEVERPDTPQIRGLVAKVPHLVEIVEATPKAAWTLVPEYTIYPPEAVVSKPAGTALEASADEGEQAGSAATGDVTASTVQSEIPLRRLTDRNDIEAGAAQTATETSGDMGGAKVREPADASGEESANAGDTASLEERSPEA